MPKQFYHPQKMTDEERREALASAKRKIREWMDEHGNSPHDRHELISAVEEEENSSDETRPLAKAIAERLTGREKQAMAYEAFLRVSREFLEEKAAVPLPAVLNEDALADLAIMVDEDTGTVVPLLKATWPDLLLKQKQVKQTGDREQIDRWAQLLRRVEPLMQSDPTLRLDEALRASVSD
jgi:hypothetical protein